MRSKIATFGMAELLGIITATAHASNRRRIVTINARDPNDKPSAGPESRQVRRARERSEAKKR